MRDSEVWKNVSEAEFDNAMEGMEKLVMNRLYDLYVSIFVLSPHIVMNALLQHLLSTTHTCGPTSTCYNR